jgi:hypothetical protein
VLQLGVEKSTFAGPISPITWLVSCGVFSTQTFSKSEQPRITKSVRESLRQSNRLPSPLSQLDFGQGLVRVAEFVELNV